MKKAKTCTATGKITPEKKGLIAYPLAKLKKLKLRDTTHDVD